MNTPEGLHWLESGHAMLSGPMLKLFERIDALFRNWAREWQAREYSVPSFLPASEMHKIDYFRSFPHLITFPITLNADESNLLQFTQQNLDAGLDLTETAPVQEILTPAACYHFYILLQQKNFDRAQNLTTIAKCFRKELSYLPLQRQWSFSMREIVCLGTMEEVQDFLKNLRMTVEIYFTSIGFPVEWIEATDPFFNPSANPKYLTQILEPVKTEMLFENRLAIGSINFHRNFFGEAFKIQCMGTECFSGCVAFGVERWMHAFLSHFGPEESSWPLP